MMKQLHNLTRIVYASRYISIIHEGNIRPFESQKAVIIDMIDLLPLLVKVTITLVIESALVGCTLVPSMRFVGEIPRYGFWKFYLAVRSSSTGSLNAPYHVVSCYQV